MGTVQQGNGRAASVGSSRTMKRYYALQSGGSMAEIIQHSTDRKLLQAGGISNRPGYDAQWDKRSLRPMDLDKLPAYRLNSQENIERDKIKLFSTKRRGYKQSVDSFRIADMSKNESFCRTDRKNQHNHSRLLYEE